MVPNMAVMVDHDVRRFQVTKNDRLGLMVVQVHQDIAQFNGPGDRLIFGDRFVGFAQDRLEVFSLDELHHQIGIALVGEVVVDAGDGRMGECCQQIRLAFEIAHDHLVHRLIGSHIGHFFHGDELGDVGEVKITALVDRAHSSVTEHTQHQVAILESNAGLKLAERPSLAALAIKRTCRPTHRSPAR
jgi:hypothetical protein